MYMSGATVDYMISLEKKYGREFVDKILAQRGTDIKLDVQYLETLTTFYEGLLTKNRDQLLKLTKNYNGFINETETNNDGPNPEVVAKPAKQARSRKKNTGDN